MITSTKHVATSSFSLAICTYNRAPKLATMLHSIEVAMAAASNDAWEVLVVDNNSNDSTHRVCDWFAGRLPLRYVFEAQQGLSNARNRAIAECTGALLVFTDDDILVGEGWLAAYAEGFKQHPDAAYFGGPIHPYWPEGRPRWIKDERMPLISGLLGYYDLEDQPEIYRDGDMHPFGANFALNRPLFERLAPFRVDLGVSGSTPGRGEEAEYFRRAKASGGVGVYLPNALCLHTIQKSHLTLNYLYRYGIQKGVAARLIDGKGEGRRSSFFREATFALRGLLQLAKGRGDRARQCVINMGIQRGRFGTCDEAS